MSGETLYCQKMVSEIYTFMLDAGANTSLTSRIDESFQFTTILNGADMLVVLSGEVRNVLFADYY